MKKYYFFLFILFFLFACKQENINSKTVITGHVSNFQEGNDKNVIELFFGDILKSQTKYAEIIDSNGNFRFEPEINYPINFYLRYSSLLTFYISPGDSIHFEIDGNCQHNESETYTKDYAYYKVTGDAQKMNEDISAFYALFLDSINNYMLEDSLIVNLTPIDYKQHLAERSAKWREFLNNFNKENNPCKQFQEWGDDFVKFKEWDDLMRYPWLHPLRTHENRDEFKKTLPENYYDFIQAWDKENQNYLKSSPYISVLHEYNNYYTGLLPKDAFDHLDKNNPDDIIESFKIRIKHIKTEPSEFIRDILLAKMFYLYLDSKYYNSIKEVYDPTDIKDPYWSSVINEKFEYEKNLFENPEFSEGSKLNELKEGIVSEILDTIINRFPNKVIYIDFWAPWCSPCMGEMPHSKELKNLFTGKDVVFVYLANRCTEDSWKTTIAEKKIEGEHFLLNDKQFAVLSEKFNITGIPTYILIDKTGSVVNAKAPRPSSGEELINLINKCLEQ